MLTLPAETAPATPAAPTWHDSRDYRLAYAETDDPRVLALVYRDDDAHAPDGDAYAPAYWYDPSRYTHRAAPAGDTYRDDDAFHAVTRALDAFGHPHNPSDPAARYLRIFHGIRFQAIHSTLQQGGDSLIIIDSPAYRAHVGNPIPLPLPTTPDPRDDWHPSTLDGDAADWQAYLDGDVYGIGYAYNPNRTLANADTLPDADDLAEAVHSGAIELDLALDLDEDNVTTWHLDLTCWGFYGENYAKEESLSEAVASVPNLPALLDVPEVNA